MKERTLSNTTRNESRVADGQSDVPTAPLNSSHQAADGKEYMRHLRTDLMINRFYGKIMPRSLRAYLRRSTTPRLRTALRGYARSSVAFVADAGSPVRGLPFLAKGGVSDVVVRRKRRTVLAAAIPDLTPISARRLNFEIVRTSLDKYEVPYFLVRSPAVLRFRLAVPARYRSETVEALTHAARHNRIYVRLDGSGLELATKRSLKGAADSAYLRVTRFQSDPTRCLVLGEGYGCEIEFWEEEGTELIAPRNNLCTVTVPRDEPTAFVGESALSSFSTRNDEHESQYPTIPGFTDPIYSDITFPIDVVYTWVDGSDLEWQRRRAAVTGDGYHPQAANLARFVSHDELRYSLRSLSMNMPWIRNIYLVTDRQIPDWLNTDADGIRVVDHREIFSDTTVLPTFNSHAIESQLHHIDGLSEHFLYLNDDVSIGAPTTPDQFFLANGISKFFPSTALVPLGEPEDRDIPSSIAGKNNRELIKREFSTLITHKMKHVAHALRRSVLAEIEERFPEAHRTTAANRLRNPTDISVTSSLHHYYAFHTGRAVPGEIRYRYFDLGAEDAPARLRDLLAKRNYHVICLNDTTGDGSVEFKKGILRPFLEAYYPIPSRFEL